MQRSLETKNVQLKLKVNELLGNQYTNLDKEVTTNQKNYYISCRRMLQIEIKTEEDYQLLELMAQLLEASVEVNKAIISCSENFSKENQDLLISKNNDLSELIEKIKSEHNKSIDAGKRALLIQKIAVHFCFVSYLTTAVAFACLAPDLFLIGNFGGVIIGLLGGELIARCTKGIYEKDCKVYSLISETEDATNRRNKTFSKFFENPRQNIRETREDADMKTLASNS
jgi:hypothetical protein